MIQSVTEVMLKFVCFRPEWPLVDICLIYGKIQPNPPKIATKGFPTDPSRFEHTF